MPDIHALALSDNHSTDRRGGYCGDEACLREPAVLRPWHRAEARSISEAAAVAGRSIRTIREWCLLHDIGRKVGGHWAVSIVALTMWLEGNKQALANYLVGDRSSPMVTEYFQRCGVPLPTQGRAFMDRTISSENEDYRR